jgi:hypothetical protein
MALSPALEVSLEAPLLRNTINYFSISSPFTQAFVFGKGSLTLASAVLINGAGQNLTLTAGNLNMNGYALTVGNTMTKAAGVLTVNGTVVGTGALYGGTVVP